MKTTVRVAAVMTSTVLALAAAGCGNRDDDKDPSAEPTKSSAPKESHPDVKACMVSDSGGFNDKSFNQTSHDGLVNAKENLGVTSAEIQSNSNAEYADNITEMVKQDCDTIITVGFLLGDATAAAAKKNPDVDFAIVDYAYDKPAANVKGLVFDTGAPSYLAGYLAAGMTKTGVVGTFGGAPIPTVTVFMDGFAAGVAKYNEDNGTDVKVVGWNPATQKGSFSGFEKASDGRAAGAELITQGADIVFPVAGPAGLGALAQAKEKGAKAIWVDTDGCVSASAYCDILLTSVMKGMDVAVEESIRESANDKFTNVLYSGTLANGGVDLAPYHEADGDIPDELKEKIEELKQQLIDGTLKVG